MKYLKAQAGVRYWEDATVNGVEDADGSMIPFRYRSTWEPLIDIENGTIVDWPHGIVADVHYKVCDMGHYWLHDSNNVRVAKYNDHYVPSCLSPGTCGYGDYIILKINGDGVIENWNRDLIDLGEWANFTNDKES